MDRPVQPYLTEQLKPSPEILEIQPLMLISDEDRENLKEDIQKNGIRDAIKVYYDKAGQCLILGGLTRWQIAQELKIKYVPIEIYSNLKPKQRKQLVIDDNLNRRHLTRSQKQKLISFFLKTEPEQSDRTIAKKTLTDHKTVSRQRKKLESTGELPQLKKRTGIDGKVRKQPKIKKEKTQKITPDDKHRLAYSRLVNGIDGIVQDFKHSDNKQVKAIIRELKETIKMVEKLLKG